MTETEIDPLALALLERVRAQRLPRALDIRSKVDAGVTLDDSDLSDLGEVPGDAGRLRPDVDRAPGSQEISARMIHRDHENTAKALANARGPDAPTGIPAPWTLAVS